MSEVQSRVRSKYVWVAIIAQVIIIVALFFPQIADYIKVIGACVVEIATVLGILNNPSNADKF